MDTNVNEPHGVTRAASVEAASEKESKDVDIQALREAAKTDPYAMPALMPSSADRTIRSFDWRDFAVPTATQEDFRYTPVDRMERFFEPFTATGATQVSVAMIDGSPIPGTVSWRLTPLGEAPATVGEPADRVEAVEWNAVRDALVVTLDGRTDVPVLIRVHGTGGDAPDAVHIVIAAGPEAKGDVVIEHDGTALLAEGVEISTGTASDVSVTSLQAWGKGSMHVGGHRIRVGEGATLRHNVVTLGGDFVRLRMDQDFAGPGSKAEMLGIYFVEAGQHIEHRTMVVHNAPECVSRVIYKGALAGATAHSTWVGNALIEPTAPGTDSYELNRNLLLTRGAIADSEPNLEIENGDIVGAGHASSVGRFDDEQLFYLESRGVPESEARKLVVHGFFRELVEQIGIEQIDGRIMDALDARLDAVAVKNVAEPQSDAVSGTSEEK